MLALLLSPLVVASTAAPAAADDPEPDVVVSTDFEDSSWEDAWGQSGGPTLSLVDDDGNQVLEVAGRAADYEGIETKPAVVSFEEGITYSFSARMKLADDAGGPLDMRAVRKVDTPDGPQDADYAWVGNTSVGTEWTDIVGTFSIPEGADASTAAVYFGTSDNATSTAYTYYVDDILITKPASGPAVVFSSDFEEGATAPWQPRHGDPSNVVLSISDDAHEGNGAMLVTGRAQGWHGPQLPVGSLVTEGTYQVSGWVKLPAGTEGTAEINFGMQQPGASNEYPWLGGREVVGADEWVQLSGSYTVDAATPPTNLYIESASATQDFLVDSVVVLGPPSDAWSPTPDPDFVPGGAVGASSSPINAARGTGDVAALTFDDGPNGATTERLLDFLGANDIEATFCVIGQNIEAPGGAEVLQRIVADGHTLCNHSTSYAPMGAMSHSQVENDLKANLEIIRDALGDPNAQVPYFRAPNGDFGVTGEVAAALGMQPLGLGNMIADWGDQPEVDVLEANLRAAVQPGAVVLVHDGGGEPRTNGIEAVENVIPEFLADGWTFTLPRGGAPVGAYTQTFDFEDGTLQGWSPRAVEQGAATVEVTDAEAHDGTYAAIVTDRVHQGQGIGYTVSDVFQSGVTYDISAWLKFADGETPGDVWLSLAQTTAGTTSFGTVAQFTGLSAGSWVQVEAALTMPSVDEALLYFETAYDGGNAGNTSTFLVDDVVFSARVPGEIQDLTPLKDTVPFPMGVAIDARETLGAPSELLLKHFNQISAENHMKVDSFYAGPWDFRPHPQAIEIMDFAVANDLNVYGHVLVWHSQTPEWFFQDDDGELLPGAKPGTESTEAGKAIMRERMETHIKNVAEAFADEYGLYGSDTNPLVAWDVINEVVNDGGQYADGLRRSHWYNILGEEFIHRSFEYADKYFNDVYADPSKDRPIKLLINDYNTEQAGKQDRYHALVERLVANPNAPIDGVGHQFHVSVAQPTSTLEAAIERFQGMGLVQAVTELDVTLLTDSAAQIVEQGHYYKRAFDVFRAHADDLAFVTVWGLTDGRSWRSAQKPLLFDDSLQAKPAFYGAANDLENLPPIIRAANVFAADITSATTPPGDDEWGKLRLHEVGPDAGFQLRWSSGQLTAYVEVADSSADAYDGITFEYGDQTVTFNRDGSGDVSGQVVENADGYAAVVDLPLAPAPTQGSTIEFDVRVTDGGSTAGWNSPGELGILTLVEELSYVEVPETLNAPVIDGNIERDWYAANVVRTEKTVDGTPNGAKAEVRTLWKGEKLYVLMDITDPVVDTSHSNPWEQDSVEIYVDGGNFKAGGFRYDDTQIRINADNVVSFGTGDEGFQANRVHSATKRTENGWLVEAEIDLLSYSGLGTFHGLDFQVNDGAPDSNRVALHNWADPTGTGYQSTTRWGVGQLVGPQEIVEPEEPGDPDPELVAPKITSQPKNVQTKAGRTVTLRAAASGTPKPTVQWQKRAAGKSTWSSIRGATSTTLKVKNSKKASGTRYRAVFTNSEGRAITRGALVRVAPVKARVTLHPKSALKVKAGKRITLRAKAKASFPKAKVQWQQRKPGGKWRNIKGERKNTLKLVANHKTDKVRYRAVFSNKAGKVRTKSARVTVRSGKPAFSTHPHHTRVRIGKTATFKAVIAAKPKAKLQWYSKAPGARTWVAVRGATKSTLRVRVNQARSGTQYVAIATSSHGWTASKMARLTARR